MTPHFDTTLKVEWAEFTGYNPKPDIKPHENAPKRPQLKDALLNGSEFCIAKLNYDCLTASYDTLRVVMMLAKLAVMSGEATFEVR